ncbi:MAG: hypothetical protein RLZZ04_201 [Cyanobacteriota bacterium]
MSGISVLVLHGPNLNLLGLREPEVYGLTTLDQVNESLRLMASKFGVQVDCLQSNHEGNLVDAIHNARGVHEGILINPGVYTRGKNFAITRILLLLPLDKLVVLVWIVIFWDYKL